MNFRKYESDLLPANKNIFVNVKKKIIVRLSCY